MGPGAQLGLPGSCWAWKWGVEFFPTQGQGQAPGTSAQTGFVVQRVDVSKIVRNCDGTIDQAASEFKTLWEYFQVRNGVTNDDTFQIGFPAGRRTSASITLSAGYVANIQGAQQTAINPLTNPGGADGTLNQQPTGFQTTLTRQFHGDADCCGQVSSLAWSLRAYNSWGTYSEFWFQRPNDLQPSGEKVVNGSQGPATPPQGD